MGDRCPKCGAENLPDNTLSRIGRTGWLLGDKGMERAKSAKGKEHLSSVNYAQARAGKNHKETTRDGQKVVRGRATEKLVCRYCGSERPPKPICLEGVEHGTAFRSKPAS